MTKRITLFILICLTFAYCKKEQGFGENNTIRGTVYMDDTLSSQNAPIANVDVYLGFGFSPNASNYSYKAKTDAQGKYEVSFLVGADTPYKIMALYERTIGSQKTVFLDTCNISIGKNRTDEIFTQDLTLKAKTTYTSIGGHISIMDSVSNSLISLSGAEVYLGYGFQPNSTNYTNKVISDANGNFQTYKIDELEKANYKIYVKKTINVGGNNVVFSSALTYSTLSAQNYTMQVLPDDGIGYMRIKTYDNNNTGQPGFTTCLFSNRTIFINSVLASGSFYSTTTNQKGYSYVSGLGVGSKYYIKSFKVFGNDTIIGKDSIIYSGTLFPKDSVLVN